MVTDKNINNAKSDETPIVEVKGLTTRFGTNTVHDNLNLKMRRGEILGVVGGSGTGKSVLLKAILGIIKPVRGDIEIWGQNQAELSESQLSLERRRLGVLFQDGALFSSLSVAGNVQVPLREHYEMSQQLMNEIAAIKISLAGLPPDAAPKIPSSLSGGMRKRAGLARALALDPQILFLDEPTAGLDPIGAAAFDQLILKLRDTLDLSVFLVTHDLDTLYTICDRVAVLAEKQVIEIKPVHELEGLDHPWIKEYFRGPRSRLAKEA